SSAYSLKKYRCLPTGGEGPPYPGRFQSFFPSRAPAGVDPPSASARTAGAMSYSTQCTHVIFGAAGSGASGAWAISGKLFVPAGVSDQASGGATSLPSHVCRRGIAPPAANAEETSF